VNRIDLCAGGGGSVILAVNGGCKAGHGFSA